MGLVLIGLLVKLLDVLKEADELLVINLMFVFLSAAAKATQGS